MRLTPTVYSLNRATNATLALALDSERWRFGCISLTQTHRSSHDLKLWKLLARSPRTPSWTAGNDLWDSAAAVSAPGSLRDTLIWQYDAGSGSEDQLGDVGSSLAHTAIRPGSTR